MCRYMYIGSPEPFPDNIETKLGQDGGCVADQPADEKDARTMLEI